MLNPCSIYFVISALVVEYMIYIFVGCTSLIYNYYFFSIPPLGKPLETQLVYNGRVLSTLFLCRKITI